MHQPSPASNKWQVPYVFFTIVNTWNQLTHIITRWLTDLNCICTLFVNVTIMFVFPYFGHSYSEVSTLFWAIQTDTVNSRLADTSLLRTPRYYGQQQNPRRKLQTFDWNKLPLLRTLATTDLRTLYSVPTSQFYCFPSLVPSRPRRFRMWRHLSSLSGKFALSGSVPSLLCSLG